VSALLRPPAAAGRAGGVVGGRVASARSGKHNTAGRTFVRTLFVSGRVGRMCNHQLFGRSTSVYYRRARRLGRSDARAPVGGIANTLRLASLHVLAFDRSLSITPPAPILARVGDAATRAAPAPDGAVPDGPSRPSPTSPRHRSFRFWPSKSALRGNGREGGGGTEYVSCMDKVVRRSIP